MSELSFTGPFSEYQVAVVASNLVIQGGGERVAKELVEHLDCPIYTLRYDKTRFDKEFREAFDHRAINIADYENYTPAEIEAALDSDLPIIQGPSPDVFRAGSADRPAKPERMNADLLITTDVEAQVLAYHSGIPYISYIHHPAKRYTDYFWDEMENSEGLVSKAKFAIETFNYKRELATTAKKAERLLANSKRTRDRTANVWSVKDDIHLVYPPVETDYFTPGPPENDILGLDRFFFAPQRLVPYKNVHLLVESAKESGEHIVIAGTGQLEDYVRREAQYSNFVHSLGHVDKADLRDLYRAATATYQATLKEDFGIVPVESMSCGTPCVVPASCGFLETVGNGPDTGDDAPYTTENGILLDADNLSVDAVKDSMQSFDESDFDPQKIHENARHYSIQHFCDNMDDHIEEVLSEQYGDE